MKATRGIITGLACLALLGLATAGFAGTYPQDHNGWSIGFGVGGGSAALSFDGDNGSSVSTDRESGPMGSFRVGYPLNKQVTLGFESNGWSKTETVDGVDGTVTFTASTIGAAFFPSEGLVVRAGLGVGQTKFSLSQGSVEVSETKTGLGLTYGIGYEFRLTRRFALGPQLDGGFSTFSASDGAPKGSANWAGLGLEFNWYLLPKQ